MTSQRTVLPRHQKKDKWGTSRDKTNVAYEITDTQTKNNCNTGTALQRSVETLMGV